MSLTLKPRFSKHLWICHELLCFQFDERQMSKDNISCAGLLANIWSFAAVQSERERSDPLHDMDDADDDYRENSPDR